MPSPFPGMDPFLEDPRRFPELHAALIYLAKAALQRTLPAHYGATAEQRTWIERPRRVGLPDVGVERVRPAPPPPVGGAAVAEPSAALVLEQDPRTLEEVRESYINILRVAPEPGEPELITSIEVLSPKNKRSGRRGREFFRAKQDPLWAAGVNLVEIDLLRAGRHATTVPEDQLRASAPHFDYHVCTTSASRLRYYVDPFTMRDRLPAVDVPLAEEDGVVPLDLQPLMDTAYADSSFAKREFYDPDRVPPPALSPEDAAFVRDMLARRDAA